MFRRAFSLEQCTRSCCRRERGAFCVSWCFSSRGRSASGTVCIADESIGAGMSSEATNGDAQPPPVVCCSSARRQRLFSRTVARFSADRASHLSSPAILDPNNQGGGDVASRTVMSDPVPARNITVREKRRLAAVSRILQAKTPVSAGFVVDDLSVKFSRLHSPMKVDVPLSGDAFGNGSSRQSQSSGARPDCALREQTQTSVIIGGPQFSSVSQDYQPNPPLPHQKCALVPVPRARFSCSRRLLFPRRWRGFVAG